MKVDFPGPENKWKEKKKNRVRILSSNQVLEVIRKHISKYEEPILHTSPFKCGEYVNEGVEG